MKLSFLSLVFGGVSVALTAQAQATTLNLLKAFTNPAPIAKFAVDQQCDSPLSLKVGEQFHVNAYENTSTGYVWQAQPQSELLALTEYVAPQMTHLPSVGAGAAKTFIFTATAVGETTVNVAQARLSSAQNPIATWQCQVSVSA